MNHRGLQQRIKGGSEPPVSWGDDGGAVAAPGRLMWPGQWNRVLAPVGQVVVARLVVVVAVGRDGSKGSVVAAGSGRMMTTG